jgi:hypothetical protein
MNCNFRIGQKVIYVCNQQPDDFVREAKAMWLSNGLIIPEEGHVYTIRDLRDGMNRRDGVIPVVLLEEIRNREVPLFGGRYGEPGFSYESFRPVVDRKTDISCFKAMLNYRPKVVVIS